MTYPIVFSDKCKKCGCETDNEVAHELHMMVMKYRFETCKHSTTPNYTVNVLTYIIGL